MLRRIKLLRGLSGIALGILGYFGTTEASLAQSDSSDAAVASRDRLEEVVVTAQRRAEDLQKVPISTQVIGSQTLAEQNHNSLEELTQTVPSVHIGFGGLSDNLFIRGIGSGQNPSFEQSVAMFTDDIYHGRSRLSGVTFLDLDRIEVLKGPQSTFFGNNAIAGALNMVTQKPGDTFDASARALYGQFGQYAVEGAAGGPITDTFGVRLAVTRNGQRGWIKNVNTGQYAPDENNGAARLTLVYKPSEDLNATLKIEGSRSRTSHSAYNQPLQWTFCPPPAPLTPSDVGINGSCAQALALGLPVGLNNNENSGLPGQFNSLSTFENVLTINYRKWGQTFTSVSGFYNYHFDTRQDVQRLPLAVYATEGATQSYPEKYHQFSQEFRVASPTDQPIEYLAGAYFQTDQLEWDAEANVPFANFLGVFIPPLAPYLPLAEASTSLQNEHDYSVFGALVWNVTDRLKVSGGLRESWVKKDLTGTVAYGTGTQVYGGFVPMPVDLQPIPAAIFGLPAGISPNISQSYKALMPSAGIQYQLAPEAMVYLTYSRGFKAGGFNGYSPLLASGNLEYGPEYVDSYELGLKSKWFDDTVLANLDVFRGDYRDLQVDTGVFQPISNTYSQVIRNVAKSRSQGVELETQWAVTKDLRLSANVTYLDAYIVSWPNPPPTILQGFCARNYVLPYCAIFPNPVPAFGNLDGQPLQYSPRWSGSVTARYSTLLPREYKFITELSPYATSSYNPDPNINVLRNNGYLRLDARLTLEAPDRRWALDLIGKNLTNRIIIDLSGLGFGSKEEPRNVAVQFRYHW